MKKRWPKFKTDEEMEKFIEQDLSDYLHAGNFTLASFEYAPKSKTVSLRLSEALLATIKNISRARGIPYQRFIREALEQSVRKNLPKQKS